MATYKKRNPRKVEADLRGISTSWAQVDRLYSADGTLPNDSEHFGREVLDYVASVINDVNSASTAGLRLFDSDAFRTGDGYGGRNWDLTDAYNADVVNAYGPLVAALTNGGSQEFFNTNGGLRPARIKEHYNLVVTDSDGKMTSKNIYTIFKLYFDEYMANDFFARKALANRALDGTAADSELAARMFGIVNTEAGDASGAFKFPIGITAERPVPPGPGMVRFNTEQGSIEGYDGNAWSILGGVIDEDQDTYIDAEDDPTTDEDRLRFFTGGNLGMTLDSEGLLISTTGSITVPVGTVAQRPAPASPGMIRYNIDQTIFEGYNGAAWASLGGVMDVDQDTYIDAENDPTTDEDRLRFFTEGGLRMLIDSEGVAISTTGAITVPVGTTGQRPSPPSPGMIRYNTAQTTFEGYNGAAWASLGGVKDVDQDTYITAETNPTTDEDELTFVIRGATAALLDSEGMKISNLAGTGTRVVTVDASGNFTTATPTAQIAFRILDSTGTVLKTVYGNAI